MDHSKGGIAVPHRFHNDPHREQIVDLVYRLILVHHLLIDTEEMLHPAADLSLDIRILHMVRHFIHDLLYEFFPLCLPGIDLIYEIKEHLRLRILKRQVVKLCLDLGDAKTLSDGCIDIHRLFRLLLLLHRLHELQRP